MSDLLEIAPGSLKDLQAFVQSSLLQIVIDLQMRHWFALTAKSMKRPSISMFAEIEEYGGALNVRIDFGEEDDIPTAMPTDGLIHLFGTNLSYEAISIALQDLMSVWASETVLLRMLEDAYPRLTADRERYKGAAA